MLQRGTSSAVSDLCENSRYPGLARAVLFPVLLLIVCKEKTNHKLFHCVFEPAFTGVFPAFHMELVKVPGPSKRNPGAGGRRQNEGKGCNGFFNKAALLG